MKTLVVGDLQIYCADSGSRRSEQTRNTLGWVIDQIDTLKPDLFVHLGDFGEDNQGTDHYSLTLMTWFASQVFQRVPQSYWLTGNHDFYTKDGTVNLMTALGYLFSENHHAVFPWASGPENTMFVSYLPEGTSERWRAEAGLTFAEREQKVLFSHLPVEGAMWGPGRFDDKGLDPNWFPRHTIVGHYHRPNPPDPVQMGTGHCIWYAGSPMSHDFRDNCYGLTPEQQLRGIWLFDILDGQVTAPPQFIENPHAVYYLSFTADVEYDPSANSAIVHDDWFNTSCRIPLDRTVLQITVPPGKQDAAQTVFSQTTAGVTVLQEGQSQVPAEVQQSKSIHPDTDPAQAVVQYVDDLPAGKLDGLDPETLKQTGVSLVQGQYQLPEQADGSS